MSPLPQQGPALRGAELKVAGLSLAGRIPWPWWRPIAAATGQVLARRPTAGIKHWQQSVQALTGAWPSPSATAEAVTSWAHNAVVSMQLGQLTAAQLVDLIVMDPAQEQRLRTTAAERGVVLALPHMGSWDLAGAWACAVGMPVSTVAEQLAAPEFDLFVRVRQQLGFTVYGHRDAGVIEALVADARQRALVCLLADRNFTRRGVPVEWSSELCLRTRVPAGPAHVALASGSQLMALAATFEGERLRLTLSDPIEPDPELALDHSSRSQLAQRQQMMQRVVDFFAEQIRARPTEWHMFQPFFDLPGDR